MKNSKYTVLHLIPSLNPYGGTPKKILWQAEYSNYSHAVWNRKIFEDLEVYEKGVELFKEKNISLNKAREPKNLFSVIKSLIKTIRRLKPKVVQCYFDGDIMLIPLINLLFPKISICVAFVGPFSSRNPIKNYVIKNALSKCDYVIYNSFYTKKNKEEKFNLLKSKRAKVIYNGFTVDSIHNSKKANGRYRKKNNLNLLCVGGLVDWKNQKLLIKIIDKLVKVHKIENIRLDLLGDGPMHEEITKEIKAKKIQDYVTLHGYVNDTEQFFLKSDLYLHPALKEAFGIAVIEAMSYSMPVLLSNRGAFPELITDGKEGFLLNPKRIDNWIEKLKILMERSDIRKEMGINAFKTVENKFSMSKFIKSFDSLYSLLINEKKMKGQI